MVRHLVILFLLAAISSACASLEGFRKTVSIDSVPRGATVYRDDDPEPIGQTPLFYRYRGAPRSELRFVSPSGATRKIEVQCEFRYVVELVGNGALTALNPVAGLVGFTVDYVSGAAFQCPSQIMTRLPAGPSPLPDVTYCRKYVVAPPPHVSDARSDELAKLWREQAIFQMSGCDGVVDYATAKPFFAYLNWTHASSRAQIERLQDEKLAYVGMETGATHLVLLNPHEENGKLAVDARILDLHTRQPIMRPNTGFVVADAKRFHIGATERAILRTFQLFPNSVTFGGASNNRVVSARAGHTITDEKTNPGIPSYVSRIGLTSVEHPDAYGSWDFVARTYPSAAFAFYDRRLKLDGNRRDLVATYLAAYYNAGITMHTPSGAFSVALGAGPAIKRMKITGKPARTAGDWSAAGEALYTAFPTRDVFVQLGFAVTRLTGATMQNDVIKLEKTFPEVVARVGWFVPELGYRLKPPSRWGG